jgi:hypothetical protein
LAQLHRQALGDRHEAFGLDLGGHRPDRDRSPKEIDVRAPEREYLTASHRGVEGDDDDRPKVGASADALREQP